MDIGNTTTVTAAEEEGQWVPLRSATGEADTYTAADGTVKPAQALVAGTYSKVYRDRQAALRKRPFRRLDQLAIQERSEADALDLIATCVLAWEGVFSGATPLACTKPNVTLALGAPWFREQIETAMTDHAGFTKTPSAS